MEAANRYIHISLTNAILFFVVHKQVDARRMAHYCEARLKQHATHKRYATIERRTAKPSHRHLHCSVLPGVKGCSACARRPIGGGNESLHSGLALATLDAVEHRVRLSITSSTNSFAVTATVDVVPLRFQLPTSFMIVLVMASSP